MNIDKQALRNDAIRAGGGKWHYIRSSLHSKAYITDANGETVINITNGDVPAKYAGFLESANPATVIALLDELQAAEARIDELEAREVSLPPNELVTDTWTVPGDGWEVFDAQKVIDSIRSAGVKIAAGISVKGE